jgi:hypothetical protein
MATTRNTAYIATTLASIRTELKPTGRVRRDAVPAVGDRSGRLVVTGVGPRPRTYVTECTCGRTRVLTRTQAIQRAVTHCGRCGPLGRRGKDYTGLVAGRLTVTARLAEAGCWRARCACGAVVDWMVARILARGHCGCSPKRRGPGVAKAPVVRMSQVPEVAAYVVTGPMTLDEIAVVLGLSKQRVGQIERVALAKLRAVARGLLDPGEVTRGAVAENDAGGKTGPHGGGYRVGAGEEEIAYRLSLTGPRVGAYQDCVWRAYERRLRDRDGVAFPAARVTAKQRIRFGGRAA